MLFEPKELELDLISVLACNDIHSHGSAELLKFEKRMTRYFEREYERWRGNNNPPEHYGVSSFEGTIATRETCTESIEHYNKEFKVFRKFLDSEYLCYTSGYYGATGQSPEIDNEIPLLQAQLNKFDLIIERAEIADGQHLLELGCGFGGFAKYLLNKFPNIRITAVNPCKVQSAYIRNSLMADDSCFPNERFSLVEKFLDDISGQDLINSTFDRVVSIGVLEAVTNMDRLFKLISRVLVPGGMTFHHFIVSADTVPRFLKAEDSLMADYFPGGHIWPYSEPKRHSTHLEFSNSWFVNGMNYWKTLDEWHGRFWSAIDELYPAVLSTDDIRDWNKYFVLCKAMFSPNKGRSYGLGHFSYRKIRPV